MKSLNTRIGALVALVAVVAVVAYVVRMLNKPDLIAQVGEFIQTSHEYEDVDAYAHMSTRFRASTSLGDFRERLSTTPGLRTARDVTRPVRAFSFEGYPESPTVLCLYLVDDTTNQPGSIRVRMVEEAEGFFIDGLALEAHQLDPSARVLRAACPPTF